MMANVVKKIRLETTLFVAFTVVGMWETQSINEVVDEPRTQVSAQNICCLVAQLRTAPCWVV